MIHFIFHSAFVNRLRAARGPRGTGRLMLPAPVAYARATDSLLFVAGDTSLVSPLKTCRGQGRRCKIATSFVVVNFSLSGAPKGQTSWHENSFFFGRVPNSGLREVWVFDRFTGSHRRDTPLSLNPCMNRGCSPVLGTKYSIIRVVLPPNFTVELQSRFGGKVLPVDFEWFVPKI